MKAIVHIGTEKTGTSSIQEYLFINRKKLKSAGYHFIQSAGRTNNRAIPAYCISDERVDDFYREAGIKTIEDRRDYKQKFRENFEHEIRSVPRNTHTFLMSSEHFHSRIRTEAEMDNVYNFLSPYFDEIKIICYLREQVSTCTSLYSTHIKNSGTRSFTEILQLCNPGSRYFNYYDMLGNWERCFGFRALDVSLYAREWLLNADLLDDFTAKINPALVGTLSRVVETKNESVSPLGQALARAINITFPMGSERPEINDLRSRCAKIIAEKFAGKGQQPNFATRKIIYDKFIESNEQVRQKFFPNLEILFPPPSEAMEPDTIISEHDFEGIADVFTALKRHGKGVMLSEEYTRVCSNVYSCISDITKVESPANEVAAVVIPKQAANVGDAGAPPKQGANVGETETISNKAANEEGTQLAFNQDDATLLLCAAGSIQGRDPVSAFRLAALALRIFPNSPGIEEKMEEYRQRSEQAQKPQYFITYYGADSASNPDKVQGLMAEFQNWIGSLDVPEGSPLNILNSECTVHSDGTVEDCGESSRVGFSIFEAESLDDALSIAQSCPHLNMGGALEVSEIEPLRVF